MSLAIISDIHGNLPALEAVIADIARAGVDDVVVNGDLVGRGPQGTAVVERIEALGWPCVGGNHEEYLLDFVHGRVPEEWWGLPEWAASRWMAQELTSAAVEFIDDLPFALERGPLHIVHGTLDTNREGLGSWSTDDELVAQLDRCTAPVLVCAHTHRAMVRHVGGRTVVNIGSVGLPFNGDTRAQYAIFHGASVELRQVTYDRARLRAAYTETGFLEAGGPTAELLLHEVEHARPFLVPFLKWCDVQARRPLSDHIEEFLAWHEPFAPLGLLYEKLARMRAEQETQ